MNKLTGTEVRQDFIDFFKERGHTFVQSASLVPGGDQTLLFTNAGMVQFKDVFLGTDKRPYNRAANSQKCMRVAGKHNDLDDVGQDDTHHTFFEMLGNWSFGDYYKKEAITWAWELLTERWGLPKDKLWVTYFKDEKNQIAADDEAKKWWGEQPGIVPEHILPFGRKENFWEMADTGPCGPCSEIHIDRGPEGCDKKGVPGHVCQVNGDCKRYLELWNLVFMQYNRLSPTNLIPLPATHVDTGMGLERIVSVMQGVKSNYQCDLLSPLMDKVQELTGDDTGKRAEHLTPYRVLSDHSRAATFLIADGVVPGNTGRNYICRMIIRRAARFGSKIGLNRPFLAEMAKVVIDQYGSAYPELIKNEKTILDSLTREEKRFQRTVESGVAQLDLMLEELRSTQGKMLDGARAFDLYATHGLPLEITRDIAREQDLDVDENGFKKAMVDHRLASGAGKAFGDLGGEDVDVYRPVLAELQKTGKLDAAGVKYDPYTRTTVKGEVLALIVDGDSVRDAQPGDTVEVILPDTCFYIESGGQVSDAGRIFTDGKDGWTIRIDEMRKPAAGVIIHIGEVISGTPKVGDQATGEVDIERRGDIQRNHTATHLLHAALHQVLGPHALQAGSLVAPEKLRFDFNHPEAVTPEQLEAIEKKVNQFILGNFPLTIIVKTLQQALSEGATALFGEKYGENVRTIHIGGEDPFSYELCGGTHVHETGDIGLFLITSEGSAAAGIRRIEAVTGRAAYDLVVRRFNAMKRTAAIFSTNLEELPEKAESLLADLDNARKQTAAIRLEMTQAAFNTRLEKPEMIHGVPVLAMTLPNSDLETMRVMADRFRQRYDSGIVVLGSVFNEKPMIITAVTDDLVKKGVMAGEIVKKAAAEIGGSGGGRPNLAQAGGKDPEKIDLAIATAVEVIKNKLK
jgi:alanyl-tRNA synthetase